MKFCCHTRPFRRAFSYIEMLACIAIIGILCGIALVTLSHPQREAMTETVRQQNAASLASMAVCLEVAGMSPVIPNDLEGTIRRLMHGVVPESGPLAGHRFVVSGIEESEVAGIASYLSIENGELIYRSESPH